MRMRTGVLTGVLVLAWAASAMAAAPLVAQWQNGTGFWDDANHWIMPPGALMPYPDSALGEQYQCILGDPPGTIAAVRTNATVWEVDNNGQTLMLANSAALTVESLLWNQGEVRGTGFLTAAQIDNDAGLMTVNQFGMLMDVWADTINQYDAALIHATNGGEITLYDADVNNIGGSLLADFDGLMVLDDVWVDGGNVGVGLDGEMGLVGSDLTNNLLAIDGGEAYVYGGLSSADDVRNQAGHLGIDPDGWFQIRGLCEALPDSTTVVQGTLEMGDAAGSGLIFGGGTVTLQGGTLTGDCLLGVDTWVTGFGTVNCTDLEFAGGGTPPELHADGGTLVVGGTVHGHGFVRALPGSTLQFDSCDLDLPDHKLVEVQAGAGMDAYDSVLVSPVVCNGTANIYDSTFYDEVASTGYSFTLGDAAGLNVYQGTCHVSDLTSGVGSGVYVAPGATLQVDSMMNMGTYLVEGALTGGEWSYWDSDGGVIQLAGGELQSYEITNTNEMHGYGSITTDGWSGLWQSADVYVQDGVLELTPHSSLTLDTNLLEVAFRSEFFVNTSWVTTGYEPVANAAIRVMGGGILRLHDATLEGIDSGYDTGDLVIDIGGYGVAAGGEEMARAQMICTGENHVYSWSGYTPVLVGWNGDLRIDDGRTYVGHIENYGRTLVEPGAELWVQVEPAWDPESPATTAFYNDGYMEVGGLFDLRVYSMYPTDGYGAELGQAINDGYIHIREGGRMNLAGTLQGYGDIEVEGVLDCEEGAQYLSSEGGVDTIQMSGGTLQGALATDHNVEGYGTITGDLYMMGADVYCDEPGRTLHLDEAEVVFGPALLRGGAVGTGPQGEAELAALDDGSLTIEDSSVNADLFLARFLVQDDLAGEFRSWMLVRGAHVGVPGIVRGEGMLLTLNEAMLQGVDIREGGEWQVLGDTQCPYVGVGTSDPERETFGGGAVYIAPEARLTTCTLVNENLVEVRGTLHFVSEDPMMPCTIDGMGRVEMAGGVLSGDCGVTHYGEYSIHGCGRISAALTNYGSIYADHPGGWLHFDTNDKVNEGTISAEDMTGYGAGAINVDAIRLDNYGVVYIDPTGKLLVDAGIIDCHDVGTVDVLGDLELRRGGSIVNCPVAAGVGSTVTVGACGQETGGPVPVDANEFALGGLDLDGSMTVINPAVTGQAAPDTGDTILTMGGDLNIGATADIEAELGSTLILTGNLTNALTTPAAFRLDQAIVRSLSASPTAVPLDVEVAGEDVGIDAGGWSANYVLGALQIGTATQAGRIALADATDNQGNGADNEALYVDGLSFGVPGSYIDLNDLNVYYQNGSDNKKLFYGDATLDGTVDTADYFVMAGSWFLGDKTWYDCDFTGDGVVDTADYFEMAANWFKTSATGAAGGAIATPEPATMVLVAAGLAMAAAGRRRR